MSQLTSHCDCEKWKSQGNSSDKLTGDDFSAIECDFLYCVINIITWVGLNHSLVVKLLAKPNKKHATQSCNIFSKLFNTDKNPFKLVCFGEI